MSASVVELSAKAREHLNAVCADGGDMSSAYAREVELAIEARGDIVVDDDDECCGYDYAPESEPLAYGQSNGMCGEQ